MGLSMCVLWSLLWPSHLEHVCLTFFQSAALEFRVCRPSLTIECYVTLAKRRRSFVFEGEVLKGKEREEKSKSQSCPLSAVVASAVNRSAEVKISC